MSLVVHALFFREASWYKYCLVSHDVSIYCMMELRNSLHVLILHPRHHSPWTGLLFILGYHSWKVLHQWCPCIRHIILDLELSSLVLQNKSHPSLLVYDYVYDLSYKSNAFVWIETFHKEYSCLQILMHIWSCNYFIQYNIHPYLTETFLDAFHLYQGNIEIVH